MQRRTTDFWLQSFSSFLPFEPHSVHLQDTLQGSLVLLQTNAYNTDARSYKHPLSILDIRSLFNMPLSLRLGPLKFSSFPRHQPSISTASKHYTTAQPSHWRSGEFQQLAKQLSKQSKKQKLTTQNVAPVFFSSVKSPPPLSKSSCRFFLSFPHKPPMHHYNPHVPKIINPAAFINPAFRRA